MAFHKSIQVHRSHLQPDEEPGEESTKVVEMLQERLSEDFADDEEKDRAEETAQAEASGFFDVTGEELQKVEELVGLAEQSADRPDSKVQVLLDWFYEEWEDQQFLDVVAPSGKNRGSKDIGSVPWVA